MTGIQQKLATGRGKFTPDYPDLGTGPVNYEDSISEEFFAAERKAVFERSWLCVGRDGTPAAQGSYFTRELPGRLASIVITRDLDDNVYAFHNVCAHRGNKVVWQEHPQEESAGSCRAFACKYHGWRYGLNGVRQPHHQRGGVLRPRQEQAADAARALRGLGGVHLHQPRRGSGAAAHLPRRGICSAWRPTRSI